MIVRLNQKLADEKGLLQFVSHNRERPIAALIQILITVSWPRFPQILHNCDLRSANDNRLDISEE